MDNIKNNIILIGMPGVGKSTVGVVLAKMLGYEFLDSDLVIQKKEGRRLPEIIASEGIDGFLKIEDEVNHSIITEGTVIATGGSAVYGERSMKHLADIGTVVYLKVGYSALEERLGNLSNRGVIMKDGQSLKELYEERCPLYERYAEITVDEESLNIWETVNKIRERLG